MAFGSHIPPIAPPNPSTQVHSESVLVKLDTLQRVENPQRITQVVLASAVVQSSPSLPRHVVDHSPRLYEESTSSYSRRKLAPATKFVDEQQLIIDELRRENAEIKFRQGVMEKTLDWLWDSYVAPPN